MARGTSRASCGCRTEHSHGPWDNCRRASGKSCPSRALFLRECASTGGPRLHEEFLFQRRGHAGAVLPALNLGRASPVVPYSSAERAAFQPLSMTLYQLQNLLMQRRLQLQFQSRLPIQPEFIQHAPFNSLFTFRWSACLAFFFSSGSGPIVAHISLIRWNWSRQHPFRNRHIDQSLLSLRQ